MLPTVNSYVHVTVLQQPIIQLFTQLQVSRVIRYYTVQQEEVLSVLLSAPNTESVFVLC